jgi:hypothetical protein
MSNIIFCPAGIPLNFHDAYDKMNHWRYTKETRNYRTVVCQYNDYVPDTNTYDFLVKKSGYKWDLVKHFLELFDYAKYEYIGFWDDDLVTDIQNVNRALQIASEKNIKLFQLSTIAGSDSTHRILHQRPELKYTLTNFNEGMGQFIHSSLIPIILEFFECHDVKSGWGFDLIISAITKEKCGVIHETSMYHPGKQSYYDKSEAFEEMYHILNNVYPEFMKKYYNEEVECYKESQTEYEMTFRSI